MQLLFNTNVAQGYKSNSQIARRLTEDWVLNNSYCPSCGFEKLSTYCNNNPATDFYCNICKSDYELKSGLNNFSTKIVDGAYDVMMDKILNYKTPNFLFLNYSLENRVSNYFSVPKYFIIPEIIQKRKPLNQLARRAGWIGCNILIKNLPTIAKIFLVKNQIILSPLSVISSWEKTVFLKTRGVANRSWLIEIMSLIDKLPGDNFCLSDLYRFENELSFKFSNNKFIREKIRQQLQVLRDKGYILFQGNGIYKRI